MKEITITSLTEKGKIALVKHYEESRTIRSRALMKAQGIKQTLESQDPFIIKIEIVNKHLQVLIQEKQILSIIIDTMIENDPLIRKDIDYKVVVV